MWKVFRFWNALKPTCLLILKYNKNRYPNAIYVDSGFLFIMEGGIKNMSVIIKILGTLVAIEFVYILYLETFATTSKRTAKVFNQTQEELERSTVNALLKNQGVYNGLIGGLILLAIFMYNSQPALLILMIYTVLVAIYGGITSNPKIILLQGGVAMITMIAIFIGL